MQSQSSHTESLIEAQITRLREDFGLIPITATEIEFYLPGATASAMLPHFWQKLETACAAQGFTLYSKGAETGTDQFEAALTPAAPLKTVRDTATLKSLILTLSGEMGFPATFAPKPFESQPGSGLHLHLSLQNHEGKNTFFKNDHSISPELKHSLGGLIAWLPACMPIFAPTPASYARFTARSNAPTTVSWGANNRTTALRLPDAPHHDKHIELRVPGSDADPALSMAVFLAATHYGLTHASDPGPQIHGDAALPNYNLPKLPATLEEGQTRLQNFSPFHNYFALPDLL